MQHSISGYIFLLAALLFPAGCSAPKPVTLMATPVIYSNAAVDPFAHLNPEDKTTLARVFYATNRMPQNSDDGWYLSHDYPERVRQAAERELKGLW